MKTELCYTIVFCIFQIRKAALLREVRQYFTGDSISSWDKLLTTCLFVIAYWNPGADVWTVIAILHTCGCGEMCLSWLLAGMIENCLLIEIFLMFFFVFLFLFCNRGDTIQYHGGLRSRELGQAPMVLVQALSSHPHHSLVWFCTPPKFLSLRSRPGIEPTTRRTVAL